MKRVFLADAHSDERLALRMLIEHLNMQVVGETVTWTDTLALAPATQPDVVLIDWGLIEAGVGRYLPELRKACPATMVIVLISHLDARDQAALASGADAFISKGETSDRIVERLRAAVEEIRI